MVGALAIDQDIMPITTPEEFEPQAQAQGASTGLAGFVRQFDRGVLVVV